MLLDKHYFSGDVIGTTNYFATPEMKRFILVTGASSGIGEFACKLFAESGYWVLAGVRNPADAARIGREEESRVIPLMLDVTSRNAVFRAAEESRQLIGTEGRLVAVVNNAGVVRHGPVLYIPEEDWQQQFDINVLGVVRVIQAFFPLLKAPANDPHPRRIVNISSISGRFASPFVGPYAASKHALEALSDSLRRELYLYDVGVVLLQPGKIKTPIWEKAKAGPDYSGTEYADLYRMRDKILDQNFAEGLPVQALARPLMKAVAASRINTRYLVVRRPWLFTFLTALPASLVDRMIRRTLRRRTGFRPM